MKNCIIIHGGPLSSAPEEPHQLHTLYWQPWVKDELEKHDLATYIPPMPHPWTPQYAEWKETVEQLPVTEDSILVGHSRGCAFLVRWLSETRQCAAKLIAVAPNLKNEHADPVLKDFYTFEIDSEIQDRVPTRIVFTSENDDRENIESAQLLAKKLNCQVINLPQHGHFITEEMDGDEFPELIRAILN